MSSLRALVLAAGGLAAAPACGASEAPAARAVAADGGTRPNVVLIVLDTLRRDRLGCYGAQRATSPAIDRLAADGVRYERAYSQAPWTTPSIGSLLTSRYPSEIGVRDERSVLGSDLVLLPESLRAAGYATAAVVSHTFCSSRWGFDQGFERFDESNVQGHDAVTSEGVTDRALELLAELREPWFLWVHYFDPHFAYVGHEAFDFRGPEPYRGVVSDGMDFGHLTKLRGSLKERDVEHLYALYDSEIAFTDHHVGRLLDALRERGDYDDALVVLTADHGEEFLDHGRLGHAKTLYAELVHVPLVVKYPRGAPGVAAEPVALLDVHPTILAAAGVEAPPGVVGRRLDAAPSAERTIFAETARGGHQRMALRGSTKLVARDRKGTLEAYDVLADPRESAPRPAAGAPELDELARSLAAFGERMDRAYHEAGAVDLSDEELEQLRAMGYAGESD